MEGGRKVGGSGWEWVCACGNTKRQLPRCYCRVTTAALLLLLRRLCGQGYGEAAVLPRPGYGEATARLR